MAAVPAAVPDVALIHAHYADDRGNVLMHQKRIQENETDLLIARAAKRAIVSVEKIVSHEFVSSHSFDVWLPAHDVTAIVELPFGAHPNGCDLFYETDIAHISMYGEASKDASTVHQYMDKYVYGVLCHKDYLNLALTSAKLVELQKGVNLID